VRTRIIIPVATVLFCPGVLRCLVPHIRRELEAEKCGGGFGAAAAEQQNQQKNWVRGMSRVRRGHGERDGGFGGDGSGGGASAAAKTKQLGRFVKKTTAAPKTQIPLN